MDKAANCRAPTTSQYLSVFARNFPESSVWGGINWHWSYTRSGNCHLAQLLRKLGEFKEKNVIVGEGSLSLSTHETHNYPQQKS